MSILSAIPAELITGAVSSILTFTGSIVAMKQKQRAEEQRMLLDKQTADEKSRVRAEGGSEANQESKRWTRRFIAVTATLSVLVFPMIAPVLGLNVVTGWTEVTGGFWPFVEPGNHIIWHQIEGGVVTNPFHQHALMAVIGYYFGTSMVENARVR